MTAEERIQMAFAKAYGDPNHGLAPVSVEMMALADAIRGAEDEALERAAKVADQERDENDGRSDPAWCAANAIGDTIRSLKSKESKP